MPSRTFAITADDQPIMVDARGVGQVTVTVSNTTAKPIRGHAKLAALGATRLEWLTIDGEVERNFAANEAHQFVVRLAIPSGTPPGKYSARLNVFAVQNPDTDFTEGPVVAFEFAPPEPRPVPNGSRIPWFAIILAIILVGGGIAVAMLLRGARMPDLGNKTLEEVTNELARARLILGQVTLTNLGTYPPGRVVAQTPAAGARVKPQSSVSLYVREFPRIPDVRGANVVEATKRLLEAGFDVADQFRPAATPDANLVNKVKETVPPQGTVTNPGALVTLTAWVKQETTSPGGGRGVGGTKFFPLTNLFSVQPGVVLSPDVQRRPGVGQLRRLGTN